ncbi:alpha-glucosidase [Lactobacillus selangorensis]|uniref:Alpha-glucosidase n=1 Tax=Lactobacillus selangorensis TaxID=81857 RepID=A0A0R2FJT4_9LACO|nr:alpha-glucosidase [Lactobacillus selangorensis]KRN28856.1 alpha-glucosidase [Lactobacillus selangorensis]KRN32734.1 alpha-glucosidase [Lactobacillus selangorensis]
MKHWFEHAIIYQVYPKSFQDTNDDGIGDIAGVVAKLPYLKKLGVNTIWLNPIYISPQVDNGYDVSNYFAVEPTLGTMTDMENLIHAVHDSGMKIIMDFVMNHTSDQHPWFKDAVQNPHSIYRDYYLWAPGHNDGPPNNWGSFFGGSVWAKDPGQTNDYYFHLFDKHMPDLNWKNQEVRKSMTDVARFWAAKGIDGFRLDAFIHIAKADFDQDYPVVDPQREYPLAEPFYANRAGVQKYLRTFVAALKQDYPDLFILGEAASAQVNLAIDYSDPKRQLCDSVITFRNFADSTQGQDDRLPDAFQPVQLDVPGMRTRMAIWQSNLQDVSYPTLYWSNHDMARVATRYGDPQHLEASLKALATAMYLQRGLPIIYYGEEIGMENMQLQKWADFDDLTVDEFVHKAQRLDYTDEKILSSLNRTHKMSARGAMQWDDSQYHGFSHHQPWKYGTSSVVSVSDEKDDPNSLLHFYRQLFELKQTPLYTEGRETILALPDAQVFGYKRKLKHQEAIVLTNLSAQPVTVASPDADLSQYAHVLAQGQVQVAEHQIQMAGWSSLILERKF